VNAEEGKKDDWPETGEKENYKFLYSKERWENLLFGLYSGCTISVAKFSLYCVSLLRLDAGGFLPENYRNTVVRGKSFSCDASF